MVYSTTKKPVSSRGKPTVKKLRTTKTDHILMDEISHVDFIKAFLRIHDLTDQYSPGVHFGPQFKLWWTDLSGGKLGASTIENNHDFDVARAALLKKKKDASVQVEFDVEAMDGYQIWKRVDQDEHDKLGHGTKVPCAEAFSSEFQLYGAMILQLKCKWTCEKHHSEHGEVAADAMKHEPPNTIDFDGLCDGRLNGTKPCGHVGPHSVTLSNPTLPDATTMLLTAVTSLVASQLTSKSVANPPLDLPSMPSRHCHDISPPLSPAPAAGTE
ncbi:hypothetical protein HYDPIDRAFT_171677, partial [Hydnomerulius pinastri MD-312]